MKDEVWPKKATSYQVDGRQPRGRPCSRSSDMKALNLSVKDASDRAAWRKAIKPGTASEARGKRRYNHTQVSYPPMWIDGHLNALKATFFHGRRSTTK